MCAASCVNIGGFLHRSRALHVEKWQKGQEGICLKLGRTSCGRYSRRGLWCETVLKTLFIFQVLLICLLCTVLNGLNRWLKTLVTIKLKSNMGHSMKRKYRKSLGPGPGALFISAIAKTLQALFRGRRSFQVYSCSLKFFSNLSDSRHSFKARPLFKDLRFGDTVLCSHLTVNKILNLVLCVC